LEEWYREEASGNHWHGTCADSGTGNQKKFSIKVDSVWTPSGQTEPLVLPKRWAVRAKITVVGETTTFP